MENTSNVAFMYDRLVDRFMTAYRIAILPGDGTGREVMAEAQSLLDAISANSTLDFEQMVIPCGGQYYLETGEEWPQGSFEKCRDEADAILTRIDNISDEDQKKTAIKKADNLKAYVCQEHSKCLKKCLSG